MNLPEELYINKKVLAIYANLCYSTKMSVSMGKCAFLFMDILPVGDMSVWKDKK